MSRGDGTAATAPGGAAAATRTGAAWGDAAAVLALVVTFVLATAPWWRDGLTIPWDAKNQFYPVLQWLAAELHAGRVPDFMAEIYAGRPSLSDPQSMVTSPGFLLLAALDPAPSMLALDMLVLSELLLGGLAIVVLGRMWGLHPVACFLGALVFVFGGAPMARLQHVLLVQSYAFVPFVLLAIDWTLRRPRPWKGVLAGLAVGLLAVGRDHVAFLSLLVAAGWGLFCLFAHGDPARRLRMAVPAIAVAVVVAIVIAAAPVLATLSFAEESNRPSFGFAASAAGGIGWPGILTPFFPDLYNSLFEGEQYWGPLSDSWRWTFFGDATTIQVYFGLVPVVLVLLYAFAWRGAGPLQRFATLLVVFALLYALGWQTPAFRLYYHLVPGVDLFRRAADGAFVLNLALALLVLAGAGRYVANGLPPARRARWLPLVLAFAAATAGAFAYAILHDRLAGAAGDVALAALLILAVASLLAWGARGGRRRRVAVLAGLAAATAVDLSVFSAGTRNNAMSGDLWAVLARPMEHPAARALVQRVAAAEAAGGPVRVEIRGVDHPHRSGGWQNLSLVLGVENVSGYNPLRSAAYARAAFPGQNSHLPRRRFGEQMTGYRSALADLLGLRYILLGAPMEAVDPASAPFFGQPERIGDAFLYENPRALPRAVLVRADRTVPMDPVLAAGAGPLPDLDWRTQALVGLAAPGGPAPGAPAGEGAPGAPAGDLEIVEHAPGRLVARIAPEAAGHVILHELAHPGWTARVDGERRPLVPANGLFQAVAVGPGDRAVTFTFEGPWAAIGG